MIHKAEEDYLKLIYELTVEKNIVLVKNSDIADAFGYTDQSVNDMIQKLKTKALVKFIPYKGVHLTEKGLKEAMRLIRNHRIWEVFLSSKLGFSWSDVHPEAEMLEHASSEAMIDRMEAFLGYPEYCNHGNPIPKKNGQTSQQYNQSLDLFSVGSTFTLKRVVDDALMLRYLDEHHISLNEQFVIKEKDLYNDYISIEIKQQKISIPMKVARRLFGV